MNLHGKNILGYQLSATGKHSFRASDPARGTMLETAFYSATGEEINLAMKKAREAAIPFASSNLEERAILLERIANRLEESAAQLIAVGMAETGLPEGRLVSELGRTTGQIRMFARLVREGHWTEAVIDHGDPSRQPLPKPDIRRMLVPIGPVVVFGAGNFPLAFSVAGGDTISALAAGNPVVVKAHPGHPGTSETAAMAILEGCRDSRMPDGTFSMLHDIGFQVGQQLVTHTYTEAVTFTGSYAGGKALFDLANSRPRPIPLFAEMGSVNPVFILPESLKTAASTWGAKLAQSVTLGAGQFCTNPGLIFVVEGDGLQNFMDTLTDQIRNWAPQPMLSDKIADHFLEAREEIRNRKWAELIAESESAAGVNRPGAAIGAVTGEHYAKHPRLSEELFGPFSLVVICKSVEEMSSLAANLEGQLTATLIAHADELTAHSSLLAILGTKAGRILFNGVPTGVEVGHAMQHGGPFPASTDSRFTSVGTGAIRRFLRPVAFQDFPNSLLPEALKDDNPLNIRRLINGIWT